MIFGIDFDGTLVEHKYPEIGDMIPSTLSFVRMIQDKGHKWILFTCRGGEDCEEAYQWCIERGLHPNAVNDDIPEIKNSEFGRRKSIKPFADYYLDDRSMLLSDVDKFKELLKNEKH